MKFKVGDRVAVYTFQHQASPGRRIGRVSSISHYGNVVVRFDSGGPVGFFHPKQCRLLKQKPPVRMWIWKGDLDRKCLINSSITAVFTESDANEHNWIEFVEVKKPKTGSGK